MDRQTVGCSLVLSHSFYCCLKGNTNAQTVQMCIIMITYLDFGAFHSVSLTLLYVQSFILKGEDQALQSLLLFWFPPEQHFR